MFTKETHFQTLDPSKIQELEQRFQGRRDAVSRGTTIYATQSRHAECALLLEGLVQAEIYQGDGDAVLLYVLKPGSVLGETAAFDHGYFSASWIAKTDVVILRLRTDRLLHPATRQDGDLSLEIMKLLAARATLLLQKVRILSYPYIRQRILYYLSLYINPENPKEAFSVPCNRAEMAAYLGCERSALSKELGKLRNEGIIDFRKNRFRVLEP